MNKEYTIIGGKAIVEDENNKKRPMEHTDNLDEILIKENLIETMENRLKEINIKSKNNIKNIKFLKIWRFIPILVWISLIGIMPVLIPFVLSAPGVAADNFITQFGNIDITTFMTLFTASISIPLGTIWSLSYNSEYKKTINEQKGLENEKSHLKQSLQEEKETLIELQKNAKIETYQQEFTVKKVDDKQALKNLKSYLNLYYDCGYNEEKYYKYYEKGILHKKLNKYYTEIGIKIIEEHLESQKENIQAKKKIKKR